MYQDNSHLEKIKLKLYFTVYIRIRSIENETKKLLDENKWECFYYSTVIQNKWLIYFPQKNVCMVKRKTTSKSKDKGPTGVG